jgi:hypothetical protein
MCHIEKAKLAKCLNCDTIMYDENPSNQPELPVPNGTEEMIRGEDENGWFVGCPKCNTDGYLIDLYNL